MDSTLNRYRAIRYLRDELEDVGPLEGWTDVQIWNLCVSVLTEEQVYILEYSERN